MTTKEGAFKVKKAALDLVLAIKDMEDKPAEAEARAAISGSRRDIEDAVLAILVRLDREIVKK